MLGCTVNKIFKKIYYWKFELILRHFIHASRG